MRRWRGRNVKRCSRCVCERGETVKRAAVGWENAERRIDVEFVFCFFFLILRQDICIKLDLDDVSKILPALDEVEAALALLPQIQSFVADVDSLVWGPGGPAKKLAETLAQLGRMEGERRALRRFRGEVHAVVGVKEGEGSEGVVLEAVEGWKVQAERRKAGLGEVCGRKRGGLRVASKRELTFVLCFFFVFFFVPFLAVGFGHRTNRPIPCPHHPALSQPIRRFRSRGCNPANQPALRIRSRG